MSNPPALNRGLPSIDASNELYRRSQGLVPAHTQTLAKGPTQYVEGVAPKYLERGRGSHVWDVDGNEYIDLTMAVGPLSLGYSHPAVDDAIRSQLEEGIVFSLMHPLEVEVAELLRKSVPGADRVRFSKTGADVTSAAVRLARAFTGRDRVLCCGYHGWHDWYIGTSPRSRGVPRASADLVQSFAYGDLDALEALLDDSVACVILEPVIFQEPPPGYLRGVKQLCEWSGAVLVFDEMWTGFRVALGGAQERYDVTADLATFSKAIANGMPLSALCGRGEIMDLLDDEVFFFTTFGGEALSLAAARATLTTLRDEAVPEYLIRQGERLRDGYNRIADRLGLECTRAIGLACRSMVTFDDSVGDPLLLKSLLQQELLRHGVLWSGFHNLSFGHRDEDIEYVLSAYDRALGTLGEAVNDGTVRQRLSGRPVQPVFRKTR